MKQMRYVLAVLMLLLLPGMAKGAAPGQPDIRALVIGCDTFLSMADTSPASANNVSDVAEVLSVGTPTPVVLMTRKNEIGTVDDLQQLVDLSFAEAKEGDISYFYISTHGVMTENGFVMLLSDGVQEELLTPLRLRQMFDPVPGTKVILIDACHSGAAIGKASLLQTDNVFAGGNYKVIVSSGAEEDSWFWAGGEELGAGYFSGALVSGLSAKGGYGADENSDGSVTVTELRRYLRSHHGESTPHTYPEADDFVLYRYDRPAAVAARRQNIAGNYVFQGDLLEGLIPEAEFSFTLYRPTRIGYRLTFQKNGQWDFSSGQFFWDNSELHDEFGDAEGYLAPGQKLRRFKLLGLPQKAGGYALLQIVQVDDDDHAAILTSHVFAVSTDADLSDAMVIVPFSFSPEKGEELNFNIYHHAPCEISVSVRDLSGNTLCRLTNRRTSRPEGIGGSSFSWTGRLNDGSLAPSGEYVIHAVLYDKDGQVEKDSDVFRLE